MEYTGLNKLNYIFWLIIIIQFDFWGSDYDLADIAKTSECFMTTDQHSFDNNLTNIINGFELLKSDMKKEK